MPPDFFISRLALLIAEITRIKSEHEIKKIKSFRYKRREGVLIDEPSVREYKTHEISCNSNIKLKFIIIINLI